MLPLIEQELIAKRGWIEHKEFLDLLTLAQSVPGPIAINTSVFVGYKMRQLFMRKHPCISLSDKQRAHLEYLLE